MVKSSLGDNSLLVCPSQGGPASHGRKGSSVLRSHKQHALLAMLGTRPEHQFCKELGECRYSPCKHRISPSSLPFSSMVGWKCQCATSWECVASSNASQPQEVSLGNKYQKHLRWRMITWVRIPGGCHLFTLPPLSLYHGTCHLSLFMLLGHSLERWTKPRAAEVLECQG